MGVYAWYEWEALLGPQALWMVTPTSETMSSGRLATYGDGIGQHYQLPIRNHIKYVQG